MSALKGLSKVAKQYTGLGPSTRPCPYEGTVTQEIILRGKVTKKYGETQASPALVLLDIDLDVVDVEHHYAPNSGSSFAMGKEEQKDLDKKGTVEVRIPATVPEAANVLDIPKLGEDVVISIQPRRNIHIAECRQLQREQDIATSTVDALLESLSAMDPKDVIRLLGHFQEMHGISKGRPPSQTDEAVKTYLENIANQKKTVKTTGKRR